MNKEIADFTISLIAKKEGFNEKCIYVYIREGKLSNCSFSIEKGIIEFYPQDFNSDGYLYSQNVMCSAPTYIQLIDWVFKTCNTHKNCEDKTILLEITEHLEFWYDLLKNTPLRYEFKSRLLEWFMENGYYITSYPIDTTSWKFKILYNHNHEICSVSLNLRLYSYKESEDQGILHIFKLLKN